MTGKKSDSTPSLSKAARAKLEEELAFHREAAASFERRAGQTDTYHHARAAEIEQELATAGAVGEETDGKLD